MIGRHQLPVASPVSVQTLARGAAGLLGWKVDVELADVLSSAYRAKDVLLTDSGTSALVLALQTVGSPGGVVALPAYGCPDLAAAAVRARVRVSFYDVDPRTLSPDLHSVEYVLASGARGIVVAHLYGFPADVRGVGSIADRFGVAVIEDAAQGAGAELDERPAGSFGPLTVLSFGRGKGMTGGRGGALLGIDRTLAERFSGRGGLAPPRRGWAEWLSAVAQWSLGRPSLYGIPAAIPSLRLGETTYRNAGVPRSMSRAAAAMIPISLALSPQAIAARRSTAATYHEIVRAHTAAQNIDAIPGGVSGFLRFPVIVDPARAVAPRLGIYRSYPTALVDEPALRAVSVSAGSDARCRFPGARDLAARLVTLPTHHLLKEPDIAAVCAWLCSAAH